MLPIRVAVATRCLHGPIKETMQWAARTGAVGVQLDARRELKPAELSETGRRQFLRLLDDLGLRVASLWFPAAHALHSRQRMEQRIEAVKNAMQFASQLKANVVAVRIGRVPADADSEDVRVLREILNDFARLGNHVGVTLAMSPAGNDAGTLLGLVESVTEGPIGIDFDPASFVSAGLDVKESQRALSQTISHVRVRDAVRDADGSAVEVPVGRGEVPWDELLAVLDEACYRGWLTVDRTQGEDLPGDVARAVQYLRQIVMG